ncbi:MAG: hypothetical protein ACI4B5_05295 [Bacteroidaceae bacterium]
MKGACQCQGRCEGTCQGECEGACQGECEGKCQGECEGCPAQEGVEHNHVTRDIREGCPACPQRK